MRKRETSSIFHYTHVLSKIVLGKSKLIPKVLGMAGTFHSHVGLEPAAIVPEIQTVELVQYGR